MPVMLTASYNTKEQQNCSKQAHHLSKCTQIFVANEEREAYTHVEYLTMVDIKGLVVKELGVITESDVRDALGVNLG